MRNIRGVTTLRARLVLWSMLVNAVLLIVFCGGIWIALREVQYRQIDDTLQLSAAQVSAAIDPTGGRLTMPTDDVTVLANRGVFAWVLDQTGNLDFTTGQAASLPLPAFSSDFQELRDAQGNAIRLYRYALHENGGTIVVGMSLEPVERTSKTVLLILAAAIPLALLVSSVGAIFLAGRALNPIAAITTQARRISRENLAERLNFTSGDEVGQLAQTFDSMLDRLQVAFEHEREFVGNVSHELRTPLSMLKAQISLGLSRPRDAQTLTQMMDAMGGDVDRMTRLVESMLMLIQTEAAQIEFKPVDLGDLLSGLVSQMHPLAAEKHVRLILDVPGTLYVSGDPDHLVQLFLNLLDNALKYSEADDQVQVCAKLVGTEWQIEVSDTGIGIAPEHQSRLFDRFYRADPSRTRQTGGIGLGLAIAHAIVRQHGGRIAVQSQLGSGSTFTVFLPAYSG